MAICEKCGKEHNGSFGSGRYCSRACANSRTRTEESKQKTSNSLKRHYQASEHKQKRIMSANYSKRRYVWKVFYCKHCKQSFLEFTYKKQPKSVFCCRECKLEYLRQKASKQKNHGAGCKGKYKGIQCDSKLELVFLIYCLDHGIKIERCTKTFSYTYKGKTHLYNPDFLINNKTIIEIKGWDCKINQVKLDSIKNHAKHILYEKDLKKCYDYVCKTYNVKKEHVDVLYDPKLYECICVICGKHFYRKNKNQKTCSLSCTGKWNRKNSNYSCKGYKHVFHKETNQVKTIPPEEINDYLNSGWVLGARKGYGTYNIEKRREKIFVFVNKQTGKRKIFSKKDLPFIDEKIWKFEKERLTIEKVKHFLQEGKTKEDLCNYFKITEGMCKWWLNQHKKELGIYVQAHAIY